MDLRIFTEPQQGASYDTLLAAARATEDAGFSAFFRSDHFEKMGDVDGRPGLTDAWITLGALARETSRIRLGTLVTAATFRLPGPLAIGIAQVDQMSAGRIDVGIGTGWYDQEHRSYGIPFPSLATRFEMLTEQLEIMTGMWRTTEGGSFSFEGRHYTVVDSPALPKPAQAGGPPIIIGGGGPRKTPALAARFASEFNLPFAPKSFWIHQRGVVEEACRAVDRDPAELTYSVALVACVGTDAAEIERRAAAIGRDVAELRENGVCGTPDEAVSRLEEWRDAGAERVYLQVLDLSDLDHVALLGSDVRPPGLNHVHVTQLWRYPVKSMAGERVTSVAVDEHGIVGDRRYGLVDLDTGLVLTARRVPELLYAVPVRDGDSLLIRLPDGTLTGDDAVLSAWLGRRVHLRLAGADERGRYEIAQNDDRPDGEWTEWQGPEGVFHDSARTQLSIVSDATLGDWDVRRFRPNVVVSGAGEDAFVDHDVDIGDVTIRVVKRIDRCVIVTRPQPDLDRDKGVLVAVHRDRGGSLGVGGLVVAGGPVAVGDEVVRPD